MISEDRLKASIDQTGTASPSLFDQSFDIHFLLLFGIWYLIIIIYDY